MYQSFYHYHKMVLHLTLKNYSCNYQHEMMNYYQSKIETFLAKPLPKFHEPVPLNTIP